MGILRQINRSKGGLPKRAITGPVALGVTGVEGDRQRNLKYHGGPDKAVLMISAEVVEDLAARGYPVVFGSLGENLTVAGLDVSFWRTGQRYRIGEDAVIELTTLRSPCGQLQVYGASIGQDVYDDECHAGNTNSPHWARGGFYARVVRPGLLIAGAPVTLESDLA